MSKRYVLLKDLPDCKAGAILKQREGSDLYYYCGFYDDGDNDSWYIKEIVENNPDWFKEIVVNQTHKSMWTLDEIISIIKSECDGTYKEDPIYWNWCESPSGLINAIKQSKVKEITDTPPNPTKSVEVGGVKYLSPEEVLEREKKAFEAARGKDYFSTPLQESVINGFVYTTYKHKYPTFEDYKKENP